MALWFHSDMGQSRLEGLVKRGLLCARTAAIEWLVPGREDVPAPPYSYIVSFVPFHEHRFVMPPYRFLRVLLHHYKIKL